MRSEELEECLARAVCDRDLSDGEIPAIDLYVDQIISLVSEKNADAAPRYRERELTRTMINNYSKDGLISPIVGKKYSKEHIIEMLLVYALKNTLSISEIKRVLTGVRGDCGFSGAELVAGYHRFLDVKETNRTRVPRIVRTVLREEALDIADDRDLFVALLDILSLSAYLKAVAQELLEARYTDPDLAEKEKKEREKAEKKAREEQEKAEKREREEQEKIGKKEREEQEKAARREQKEARKKGGAPSGPLWGG